ncbi:hypothetical protein L21SP3_01589 [Sedimentisphaera cyanobacteriorum]|uniref:Phage major capsid protein, HK97 family n=1 Tax=Sedimentisphaera cyanobacteriorum TaxID=1940790 RepID=A0A1Q2HRA5_9BACT|nr:DUF5309 family protein [Sedimentisphaera cyanobacteriorum]AQQ09776.1 hypothetical protein L21SP3_01589 [Sedimentisphaera cyanobacteriorum]
MSFTGKATFTAGAELPEIAEDVSDVIGIVSPYETPLLSEIGDPQREARSTYHEWLEDSLLANSDVINDQDITMPGSCPEFDVADISKFRINDQIQPEGSSEVMLVIGKTGSTLNVTRGYGGTSAEPIEDGQRINIIGPSAVEGEDFPESRFTARARQGNWTQIFTAGVEVSGSNMAADHIGIAEEMDYQKQMRLRELLRDLENTVINGAMAQSSPAGTASQTRTMRGIIRHIQTNIFQAGSGDVPDGDVLTENMLNWALRQIWEKSCGNVDMIVAGGAQKRRINSFLEGSRWYGPEDTRVRSGVQMYESDFGVCRVILSRWVPSGTILLLDSSRVSVMPLTGRSMHFKPLASSGDYERGELIGEYTLELKNQQAHGIITGLV